MAQLAADLAREGFSTTLITIEHPKADFHILEPSVQRISLDMAGNSTTFLQGTRATLRRIFTLRKVIMEQRPKAVLSFVDGTNILTLLALLFSRIPVVVSERIDPRYHPIGPIRSFLRPILYRLCAKAVVVQTHSVAQWARSFLSPSKIWVIPNPVRLRSLGHQTAPLPDNFPLIGPHTVVAMGRLHPQKGFDILLEAWKTVASEFPDWNLVILGQGPERPQLEKLVQDRNIPSVSLPGILAQPERALQRCGLFVLSSRFEGFPNVLLEAMSCGCAVLATDCPSGPSDIVDHGQNGWLVQPGQPKSLASGMIHLLKNRRLRHLLGKEARLKVARFAPHRILPLWTKCLGLRSPHAASSQPDSP